MAVRITRKDKSAGELRQEAARCRDGKAARRMLAIALVLDGVDRKTAAENCGMDRQTLRDWAHPLQCGGRVGPVPTVARRIPPCLLSAAQKEELAENGSGGSRPRNDGVVRWRRIDLNARSKSASASPCMSELLANNWQAGLVGVCRRARSIRNPTRMHRGF